MAKHFSIYSVRLNTNYSNNGGKKKSCLKLHSSNLLRILTYGWGIWFKSWKQIMLPEETLMSCYTKKCWGLDLICIWQELYLRIFLFICRKMS